MEGKIYFKGIEIGEYEINWKEHKSEVWKKHNPKYIEGNGKWKVLFCKWEIKNKNERMILKALVEISPKGKILLRRHPRFLKGKYKKTIDKMIGYCGISFE